MRDWERYLWLTLLGPLLWLQGRYVRRVTPRLPEPPGPWQGTAGRGPLLRVLIAGDSAAAGVGAPSQHEALGGQLVGRLSQHRTVQWCLMAVNGLDSPGLLIHSALPPMHGFTALPQPLRWFMGRWALEMNRQLATSLSGQARRVLHSPFLGAAAQGLAVDGFHPGPLGYSLWAQGLSQLILAHRAGEPLTALQ